MVKRLNTFRVFVSIPGSRSLKLVGIYPTLYAAKERAEWIHITRPGSRCRIRVPFGQVAKWANESFAHSTTMSIYPRYERFSEEGPRWTFLSTAQTNDNIY